MEFCFGKFGACCGLANGSFEIHKKSHCFGILEAFGAFAGWQTAALKAHRKSLLWPWPWGACWLGKLLKGKGLEGLEEDKVHTCGGSEVPAGDGVWRVWRVLEGLEGLESFGGFAGWQTAALKA